MDLSRREALVAALISSVGAGCGAKATARADVSRALAARRTVAAKPLQLRPPALERPTVIHLGGDAYADGTVYQLDLYGEDRDWIIRLPSDAPLGKSLVIDGRSEARNVVIIGGAITPAPVSDLATTTLLDGGGYSVYALRGFSGATGGTFRVQTGEAGPLTAALPWNASPETIAAAVTAVLGAGSVRAIDGPDVPGGPWKFVPADERLGRAGLDLSGLEGDVQAVGGENVYGPASGGMLLKDFRGTVHLEGLSVGGPNCDEGIDVQTPYATARVQLASCHVVVPFWFYNDDWQHPDGMQCYLGPASLQMERCDLISYGTSALIGQPRMTTAPLPLELLRDWWFKDVLFQTRTNPDQPGPLPGECCYQEDHWPALNDNDANWHWHMNNCYASRLGRDGKQLSGAQAGTYLSYWNHYPLPPPAGLHLRATPRQKEFAPPSRRLSGLGYRSPGYVGPGVPLGTARLRGDVKLT